MPIRFMRLGPKIISASALVIAAALAWAAATLSAGIIEARSLQAVRTALIEAEHEWADVHTDGLQVHVGGEAPTEAARFNALSVSGEVVEASRVIDGTTVTPAQPVAPPEFSVEILRNDDGVSLIGLVPASLDRALMAEEIRALARGTEVTDFLESADYPVPGLWLPAFNYALDALARLPRSKISVAPGRVTIKAIADSPQERLDLEVLLTRRAPETIGLILDISSPRPVISPFTLRFLIDEERGPRFDACSADSDRDRDRIIAAAREAGLNGSVNCTLGLGVPSPEWANAVIMGIEALARLGAGTLTFSDADIALVAAPNTDQTLFDEVAGGLESNLPEVFSLKAILPPPPVEEGDGPPPPEFVATRDPEGAVEILGRLPNEMVHATVESFARARFGVDAVYMAARMEAEGLPETWPVRVLAGLSALSELDHGSVTVLSESVSVEGVSGNAEASDAIARLLTDKLGSEADFALSVTYDERLDPLADLPTAEECIRRIQIILEADKITFAPSSTAIEGPSADVVDAIAEVLRTCAKVDMDVEVAGHTDSQGREQMNLNLSEARAAAVLEALSERRVQTARMSFKGYGETDPIADNDTEEGREANRRIEFRLIIPVDVSTEEPEEAAAEGVTAETDATGEATGDSADADDEDADAGSDDADATEESTE
ncbi:MAG: OmpA family protein [Pseudomonadota bacterium]